MPVPCGLWDIGSYGWGEECSEPAATKERGRGGTLRCSPPPVSTGHLIPAAGSSTDFTAMMGLCSMAPRILRQADDLGGLTKSHGPIKSGESSPVWGGGTVGEFGFGWLGRKPKPRPTVSAEDRQAVSVSQQLAGKGDAGSATARNEFHPQPE